MPELGHCEDPGSREPLQEGKAAKESPPPLARGLVAARDDPGRRALKHRKVTHLLLQLRHELDRGRARAHDPDALAAQVDAVVPTRGVKLYAFKRVEPRNPGPLGRV